MPLARSSTLCWLLIRLASWATFFFGNFSLKLLKFGTMKLQGVVFSAWNRRVSVSFFWGVKFSGMKKTQHLETNWCLEYGMLKIKKHLCSQSGLKIWSFLLGSSDPYFSLGAVIVMRKDVHIVYMYILLYIHIQYVYIYTSTSSTCAACKNENGQDTPRRWVACLQIWTMSIHFPLPNVSRRMVPTQRATSMFQHPMHQELDSAFTKDFVVINKQLKTFLSWANRLVRSAALRYRSTCFRKSFEVWYLRVGLERCVRCFKLLTFDGCFPGFFGCFWFQWFKGLRTINPVWSPFIFHWTMMIGGLRYGWFTQFSSSVPHPVHNTKKKFSLHLFHREGLWSYYLYDVKLVDYQ